MLRASLAALRPGTARPVALHVCHTATRTQRRTNSTTSPTLPSVCPSCSAPLPTPLPACPKCRHISLVPNELPKHELFGLSYDPNPFDVDDAALKGAFRNLQRVIHPDLWSGSDHQDTALSLSAYVNNSYKILKWPVQRAEYILRRNGVDMGETIKLVDDPEFTMEIMEAREELEEAQTLEQVEDIRTRNYSHVTKTLEGLKQSIGKKEWEEAKRLCIQLKYLEGVDEAGKLAGAKLQEVSPSASQQVTYIDA